MRPRESLPTERELLGLQEERNSWLLCFNDPVQTHDLRSGTVQCVQTVVGDSHAAWRSHQTSESEGSFESLFALLSDLPGQRLTVSNLKVLGAVATENHRRH